MFSFLCVLVLLVQLLLLLQLRLSSALRLHLVAWTHQLVVKLPELRDFRALPRDRFSLALRLLAIPFPLQGLPIGEQAQLLLARSHDRGSHLTSTAI